MADERYTDPAVSYLPHARYSDPRHNLIAFLPVDSGPEGVVTYAGHVDYAWPYGRHALRDPSDFLPVYAATRSAMSQPDSLPVDVPDTGDLIDPTAPDPTPDEVTDPADPNYVEPWTGEWW